MPDGNKFKQRKINMNAPSILINNAKKSGFPVRWFQDKDAGVVSLVYPSGKVDGPMLVSDADAIIQASKDFRKKQDEWKKQKVELAWKGHEIRQGQENKVAANVRRTLTALRIGTR